MRIMAVDYGDARTGLSVSDASAAIAGESWVLQEKSRPATAQAIADSALARGVDVVVVGYPKNMDGTVGPRAEKSERLAQLLREQCDAEVVLWDERMTTISAHRILADTGSHGKKRKEKVDAVAASLILESYLKYLNTMHNS
ncbi:MAG: Holliday junction resolvase RuvX [Oscillospiraceae bacterium]|jgi:putative Holliday junction resolvase|nr:Holliday junction resolvase RuvX [Oscillospiraceae bacterium]